MTNRDLMVLAVKLADQCKPDDPKRTPRLGVVIADPKGEIIGMAHRGRGTKADDEKGTKGDDDHAELMAYHNVADKARLAGATVYTTLEPCTHHVRTQEGNSCTEILCRAQVNKVFVGILDPNQGVCGKGVLGLQDARIEVELFPHKLAEEIKSQNDPFIKAQRTLTLRITDPDPEKGVPEIKLQRFGQKITFKCKSTNPIGPEVIAMTSHNGRWWPQSGIFRQIGENNEWEFDVSFGAAGPHDVYVVKMSELGEALVGYYHKVARINLHREGLLKDHFDITKIAGLPGNYPGIELRKLSKGLDRLASFKVEVAAPPAPAG
jgi:pyrimidine deaminase RibD-like protein